MSDTANRLGAPYIIQKDIPIVHYLTVDINFDILTVFATAPGRNNNLPFCFRTEVVAAGKMTAAEMGMQFVDTLVVSSGYLVSMKIGGMIAQALFPELPGIGYAIGSLLGCSLAVVYNIGKNKFISFCVDTGFTCFGLVEQNYELPDEVLMKMNVDTARIGRARVGTASVPRTQSTVNFKRTPYETIDITVLRRGVIGVNKIGYVI